MRFYYEKRPSGIEPDDWDICSANDDLRCWRIVRMINVDSTSYEDEFFELLSDEKHDSLTRAEADKKVAQLNKTLNDSEPPFTAKERCQWETNRMVQTSMACADLRLKIERMKLEIEKSQQRIRYLEFWMSFKRDKYFSKLSDYIPTE